MPIYFPPPPPFVGGRQPYAPEVANLGSDAVEVDNPPFTYRGRLPVTMQAITAWQPPDPSAFMGWEQALQPRHLPPSLVDVPVNNPPIGGGMYDWQVYAAGQPAWQPPPPNAFMGWEQALQPRRLPPSLMDVPVNNPPIGGGAYDNLTYWAINTAWQPPPPNAFMGWLQALQPRRLPPSITAVPVNNPIGLPAYSGAAYNSGLPAWQTPIPMPEVGQIGAWLTPPPVVSTYLPYNVATLYEQVMVGWRPVDPAPILPRYLPTLYTAVEVDNPPFGIPSFVPGLTPWQPVPPMPKAGAIGAWQFGTVPYQPYSVATFYEQILSVWKPVDPAPILPRYLPIIATAVEVDNPPPYSTAWFNGGLAQWQPTILMPETGPVGTFLYISVIQNAAYNIAGIYQQFMPAWIPPPPQPILPPLINASLLNVEVDNPPIVNAASGAPYNSGMMAWQPPPPLPQLLVIGGFNLNNLNPNPPPVPPIVVVGGGDDEEEDWQRRKWLEWARNRKKKQSEALPSKPVAVSQIDPEPIKAPDTSIADALLTANLAHIRVQAEQQAVTVALTEVERQLAEAAREEEDELIIWMTGL